MARPDRPYLYTNLQSDIDADIWSHPLHLNFVTKRSWNIQGMVKLMATFVA